MLARVRMAASIAKASMTSETCRGQPCQERVSLWSRPSSFLAVSKLSPRPAMSFHPDQGFDGRAGRAPGGEEGKIITGDVAADQQAPDLCASRTLDIFVGFEVGEFEVCPVMDALALGALTR